MKIGRYVRDGVYRLAAVLPGTDNEWTVDVEQAAAARGGSRQVPSSMESLMAGGSAARDHVAEVLRWAGERRDAPWCQATAAVPWDIPVPARGVICAGRNFGRHKDESLGYWSKQGASGIHFEFPTGFIKLAHTLVPHRAEVAARSDVSEFDFEVEVVAILGSRTADVSEDEALSHVFGYTVFNDLSAREWQKKEMRNQMIVLGKNFPGYGPIGPWVLTADEVPDPSRLNVQLKVNGQVMQQAECTDMIFGFAQLISFWSRSGLSAGDMIASGTPEGVDMHRKPDPFAFYLKRGDVVQANVDCIGTLETRIV
jgi:2-keto-4-pentenoate hydratase/2-oxohepta-3-ene-1,7-dioic acid hydratase in catechol pathway